MRVVILSRLGADWHAGPSDFDRVESGLQELHGRPNVPFQIFLIYGEQLLPHRSGLVPCEDSCFVTGYLAEGSPPHQAVRGPSELGSFTILRYVFRWVEGGFSPKHLWLRLAFSDVVQ